MGLAHSREASPRSSSTNSVVPTTNSSHTNDIQQIHSPSTSNQNPIHSSSNVPNGIQNSTQDNVLVTKVFTWNFGGNSVYITGAWDHWTTRTPMFKSGAEHIALLYVPCGEFQFKYLVDDSWQCAPDLPTTVDEHGNTNNIIQIQTPQPEFDVVALLHQHPPSSPLASYDQGATGEFTTDPPTLPPHLEARSLKPLPDDVSPGVGNAIISASSSTNSRHNPSLNHHQNHSTSSSSRNMERPFFSHVFIDHLYHEKGPGLAAEPDIRCLSQTCRIAGKIVNTVLVMKKFPCSDSNSMESNGYAHDSPCRPPVSP